MALICENSGRFRQGRGALVNAGRIVVSASVTACAIVVYLRVR
jgi:hypothetical protein